jgi:hypothetical protein
MKKILLSAAACLALGVSSYGQFTENFETTSGTALPVGWTQVVATPPPSDSVGWNSGTNTTLGSTDFPMFTHTRYVAVNDDKYGGAANTNTLLISPTFSLGAGSWWLKFACSYIKGTYMSITEAATVEVTTNGGTTWTVVSTLDANASLWWEPRYIDMSAYAGMSNVQIGFRYKDNGGWVFGWGIDDIEVFSPPANDLNFVAIAPTTGTPASYGLGGSNITILGQIENLGGTTISSFDCKYVFNGGAVVTNAISGLSIAPFTTGTFTVTTPVTLPSAVGPYQLQVWAELAGDANVANDSVGLDTLQTVAFMPAKVMAVEEGTGTWCQWCPRGRVYMDSLHTLYGDGVSLVAVHNNDPMEVTAYDAWMGTQIGGYPSVMVDRRYELDPSQLLDAYTAFHDDFAFATVSAVPTLTGSSLSVAVTVKPAININGAKLALVITENNLTGTTSAWAQANAYSGSSTNFLTGAGINYNALANPIPASQMVYDMVGRSIDPSATGGAVLPASMVYNTDYSYTFTKTLDATWSVPELHGIVLLLDGSNGAVLNSANFALTVGVANVDAGVNNFAIVPNPASTTANVVFDLKQSGNVQADVYDMLGRVVYSVPATHMSAGAGRIAIPLDNNFTSGMYSVKVQTENGIVTGKFNVVK